MLDDSKRTCMLHMFDKLCTNITYCHLSLVTVKQGKNLRRTKRAFNNRLVQIAHIMITSFASGLAIKIRGGGRGRGGGEWRWVENNFRAVISPHPFRPQGEKGLAACATGMDDHIGQVKQLP